MIALLAIDPGAHTGYAMFTTCGDEPGWVLAYANVLSPDERTSLVPDIVVIENPQIYPHSKARPADILKLARVVGRYEERYRAAKRFLVAPREWKGSIDGDIMVKRIKSEMSLREKALIENLPYAHNAVDAIGLGKWALRQPWLRTHGALVSDV